MTDERTSPKLRHLPKVDAVLAEPAVSALLADLPRWAVVDAIREELSLVRKKLLEGADPDTEGGKLSVSSVAIADRARALCAFPLQSVINATGVVLHTNLGRAPLCDRALRRISELASGYCNLEYQLETGTRGSRQQPLADLLHKLTGAPAHLIVNNNAAAVLLMLSGLCGGREVIVSRGELVEIGGSFRVPDVMRASGAILQEVGTTNRTHLRDYQSAVTEKTAAFLKVHRSNFAQLGFVTEVSLSNLAKSAHERGLLCLYDLGSGALVPMGTEPSDPSVGDTDEDEATTQPEPTVKQVLAQGCDLVTLSGDKLLGGPQAGILCGKAELIAKLARHPLLRALRPDKLQLAALGATLELYRDGLCSELPTWRMLHQTEDTLRARAERLQQLLTVAAVSTDVLRVRSAVGGGAQPLHKPWSYAVSPQLPPCELLAVQSALRRHSPPVVARVARQRLLCDVRTISDAQLPDVARALRAAIRR